MSAISRKIAHVKLYPTHGSSKIEITYGNIKYVKVFLAAGDPQIFTQRIMSDFIQVISSYTVADVEASQDVPHDIRELFLAICRNNREHPDQVNTAANEAHGNTHNNARGNSRDNTQGNSRGNTQNTQDNMRGNIPIHNSSNTTQQVVAQIPSGIPNQPDRVVPLPEPIQQVFRDLVRMSTNTLNSTDIGNVIGNINQALHAIRPDAFDPPVRQEQQTQAPPQQQQQTHFIPFTLFDPTQIPFQGSASGMFNPLQEHPFFNSARPLAYGMPDTLDLFPTRQMNPTHAVPDNVQQRMSARFNAPPLNNQQPPSYDDNSEPPNRFVPSNQHRREIHLRDEAPAEPTDVTNSTNNYEEKKTSIVNPQRPHHNTVLPRTVLNESMIKQLVQSVKRVINTTNIKSPDFALTTRVGYRKIKNFIHNITKVWLTQAEIDFFVRELLASQADSNNTSNTIDNLD
jgi:hypothetical protein